jgi:hypothetical protein
VLYGKCWPIRWPDRVDTFDAIRGIAGDRDVDSGAEILYPRDWETFPFRQLASQLPVTNGADGECIQSIYMLFHY